MPRGINTEDINSLFKRAQMKHDLAEGERIRERAGVAFQRLQAMVHRLFTQPSELSTFVDEVVKKAGVYDHLYGQSPLSIVGKMPEGRKVRIDFGDSPLSDGLWTEIPTFSVTYSLIDILPLGKPLQDGRGRSRCFLGLAIAEETLLRDVRGYEVCIPKYDLAYYKRGIELGALYTQREPLCVSDIEDLERLTILASDELIFLEALISSCKE